MRFAMLSCLIAAVFSASAAHAETPLERAVLVELNAARTNPEAYAAGLRTYRRYFRENMVRMPGQKVDIETNEGVAVVDETIAYLGRQAGMAPVDDAGLLRAAAADHVAEQSANGATGHDSGDGAQPGDRVKRRGGGAYVAEVIAYGPIDAADVVRQLIVDDGVADRGHRDILFSRQLRFAGVSCGRHPEYRTMCVIDLGVTPDGTFPTRGVATASR